MSELLKEIKQSEKYPNETTSFILGNCFNERETAEIVYRCNCHDELIKKLADYKEGCEGLKLAIQDLRPYADCYKRICNHLGIEKDVLGYVEKLQTSHDDLVDACEKTEEADRYFGPADVKHKMQGEAKELRLAALAKVKKES